MKANLKTALIATALIAVALGGVALATSTAKDPTKYDCRVVVGYQIQPYAGNKPPRSTPIWECPHKDKMAAGQCEVNWLGEMRCKP
jgi:hypothetical protein